MHDVYIKTIFGIFYKTFLSLDAFRKFANRSYWLYDACPSFCTEQLDFHSADFLKILLDIFTKFHSEKLLVVKNQKYRAL
jgi:hypothetical protein